MDQSGKNGSLCEKMDQTGKMDQIRKNWSNWGKMDQTEETDQIRGKWIKGEKWINFVDKKKISVIVCLVSGEPFTGAPF